LAELLNALQAQEQRRIRGKQVLWKVLFLQNHRTICNKETEITAAATQHFHCVLTEKNPTIHRADVSGGRI